VGKHHPLSSTQEDYLEAISNLLATKGVARVRDVARRQKVRKSSVSSALRCLADKGLVNYEPYEVISLTPRGRKVAREITRRHDVIRRFLEDVLRVDSEKADVNACRIEHGIDRDVLDRFLQFVNFVNASSRVGAQWVEGFANFRTGEPTEERCRRCLRLCLDKFRQYLLQEEARGRADKRGRRRSAEQRKFARSGR